MQLPDIWQLIGSPQVAEITALVSIITSIVLTQKPSSINNYSKKIGCLLH